ncbi:hypothetical protein Q7C_25 [Methylophaga frappieri]|uniref:Uncharacterized protein n=1 Tax=Methylophaga frappieri (strain ATCC BAA-2434 / DSM 25690 / JAM7) TaxID=754477 RepID=I1YE67_METFJ|nr:hypothetical protein Q7C_25 [Methylophaga frappieri]
MFPEFGGCFMLGGHGKDSFTFGIAWIRGVHSIRRVMMSG